MLSRRCLAARRAKRKLTLDADELMAGIVAKRLVEHLALCGFVVMSGEPTKAHSAP
jgi:hypothetical protein